MLLIILSFDALHQFYDFLGDGAYASGVASDLECGNFDQATFWKDDMVFVVEYRGEARTQWALC